MNEEPDFSIVTPSYNYAQYIRECIESVKSQEGVTFEHIVQEAGSTDGTREILKEYSHLRVYEEKDSGMSDGINRRRPMSSMEHGILLIRTATISGP